MISLLKILQILWKVVLLVFRNLSNWSLQRSNSLDLPLHENWQDLMTKTMELKERKKE